MASISYELHSSVDNRCISFLSAREVVDILRGPDSFALSSYSVQRFAGIALDGREQSASSWLTEYDQAQPAPVVQSAPDKRKTRQKLYTAQILTAGGWELVTGGFHGTLPDCCAWLAGRVEGCAPYLTIYRGIKATGGLWSSAYPGAALSPVFVLITSDEAKQLA